MKDIAIRFQKRDLDDRKCVFIPLDIIRGEYSKGSDLFVTESGIVCKSFVIADSEEYFAMPTTMEKLRKTFGPEASEEALLTQFFEICK